MTVRPACQTARAEPGAFGRRRHAPDDRLDDRSHDALPPVDCSSPWYGLGESKRVGFSLIGEFVRTELRRLVACSGAGQHQSGREFTDAMPKPSAGV
ncbi:hypothetical protein HL658_20080 [Azospirillum sp. RWY-5-1]|uniref:Uncharacterized protein n=1 Tax=Azospirillum oleiclasticum TaxID=2735135 RepID=A0ABX2TDB9_9PROT|nr:hypothetical protein [Azospirillum oleiclasticum]NYZ14850.1 hypothetical protein [Azospirillum oleiclasticum]NYZ22164.1 hypothetical protein [Azospirillum oleiclasticum]